MDPTKDRALATRAKGKIGSIPKITATGTNPLATSLGKIAGLDSINMINLRTQIDLHMEGRHLKKAPVIPHTITILVKKDLPINLSTHIKVPQVLAMKAKSVLTLLKSLIRLLKILKFRDRSELRYLSLM